MSEKHVLVHGAKLKCQFSVDPSKTDELQVKSHSKHYANDKDGSEKAIATDKEIGQTLKQNTFGKCKKQPLGNGDYAPCQAVVQKWSNFYEKVTLSNKGKILTEKSKATCPMGAPDCISVEKHGQKASGSAQNAKNANKNVQAQLNPMVDLKKLDSKQPQNPNLITQ
ncbi:MAG: DUF4280 domain-containing protein [Limnohabitans sp.]|nr:DUF4280 domain-containing protein [Limnohabitans sp.]